MNRIHFWTVECLTWLLTRIWGHLLIPVLFGTISWLIGGRWLGFDFINWIAWIGTFLVIGWFLTLMHWIRFYWDLMHEDSE